MSLAKFIEQQNEAIAANPELGLQQYPTDPMQLDITQASQLMQQIESQHALCHVFFQGQDLLNHVQFLRTAVQEMMAVAEAKIAEGKARSTLH